MNKNKKSHILAAFMWAILISIVIGSVHSWHYADYTPKNENIKVEGSLLNVEEYGVVHFLTPKCSCSKHIFDVLLKRGPIKRKGVKEFVYIIDDNDKDYEMLLNKRGYITYSFTSESLKKKFAAEVKGVPLLIIYDKLRTTQYVGGYSDQLITPFTKINVMSFIEDLSKGREVASLPVKGCSVSKEYQKILDPLGLKYKKDS